MAVTGRPEESGGRAPGVSSLHRGGRRRGAPALRGAVAAAGGALGHGLGGSGARGRGGVSGVTGGATGPLSGSLGEKLGEIYMTFTSQKKDQD